MNLEPTIEEVLLLHLQKEFRFSPNLEEIKDIINICKQDQPVYFLREEAVRQLVCTYFGVEWEDIESPNRTTNIKVARHIWAWLIRGIAEKKGKPIFSKPKIGAKMGERDHSTVTHALKNVSEWLDEGGLREHLIKKILDKVDGHIYWDEKQKIHKCFIPATLKPKPFLDLK